MRDKGNRRTRGPLPKKDNVAAEKNRVENRPKMPLEIGTNDSRCKACGKLIVGKESDDLGNPNRTVSRKWTRTQLGVPRQVAKVTRPVSASERSRTTRLALPGPC